MLEPDVTRRATVEHALSNNWFDNLKAKSTQSAISSNRKDTGGGDFQTPHSPPDELPFQAVTNGRLNEISYQDNNARQKSRPSSTQFKFNTKPNRHIDPIASCSLKTSNSRKGWREENNDLNSLSTRKSKDPDKPSTSHKNLPIDELKVRFKDMNFSRQTTRKCHQPKHKFI